MSAAMGMVLALVGGQRKGEQSSQVKRVHTNTKYKYRYKIQIQNTWWCWQGFLVKGRSRSKARSKECMRVSYSLSPCVHLDHLSSPLYCVTLQMISYTLLEYSFMCNLLEARKSLHFLDVLCLMNFLSVTTSTVLNYRLWTRILSSAHFSLVRSRI